MRKFEIGKQYTHGYIGDHNMHTTWTILKRTAKTVTMLSDQGERVNCKIIAALTEMNNAETVRPFGSYSMAPILTA